MELSSNKKEISTYYCAIKGSRSAGDFEFLNKIEEGTYGVVYRAKDRLTSNLILYCFISKKFPK
jgi:cell division cycle 2-like protein